MKDLHSVIDGLRRALTSHSLVQSFSGVRTRFGDGPEISDDTSALATAYGFAYAGRVLAGLEKGILIVGRDPRPTGDAVARSLVTGFLAGASHAGCRLRVYDLGIITTPILETALRALKASGGVMITASHNPLPDNGFKFLTGMQFADSPGQAPPGALLSAEAMSRVVRDVGAISAGDFADFLRALGRVSEKELARAWGVEDHAHRVKAERAYLDSLGAEWGIAPHCLKPLTLGPALLDPNGGAACGIGARVLEHFGVRAIEENAEPGYPEHSIDTDGIDPSTGRHMLLRISRAALRANARFGIAFDYDADRGNIVLPGKDESAIIEPQIVAAMNIALVLAHRRASGVKRDRLAVVVSDATSGVSERIAGMFGAKTFMVETGEINVVTCMHLLRGRGFDVPVGVEGANGGTIFGKSTCRDGLETALCAALGDERPSLAKEWARVLKRNGYSAPTQETLRLPEILKAIPRNFNRMLRVEGASLPHGEIKARMEEHFEREVWPTLDGKYRTYRFANYEGTGRVEKRTGDETGGWRLELEDGNGKAFVFARGSRTESGVWRIVVDDPDTDRGPLLLKSAVDMMHWATHGQAEVVGQ